MKKIFTLLAVGATVISASAQDMTSTELELKNPLFQIVNLDTPDDPRPSKNLGLNADNMQSGWAYTTEGNGWSWINASNADNRSKNFGPNTTWGVRAVGGGDAAAREVYKNTDLTQEMPIVGPGPGVYVLTARVCVAKNTGDRLMNGFNPEPDSEGNPVDPQYAVLYCTDQTFTDDYVYGAPGCAAIVTGGYALANVCVPYYSADFLPYINLGIRWGQDATAPNSAIVTCTDFRLEYFDATAEMEEEEALAAVNEVLKARQAKLWEEATALAANEENGDNMGFSTSLFIGNVSAQDMTDRAAALQAIRDGGESGVSDIIAAPVQEDNRYFNLQGIEVAEPTQPGLYIHNGKKILVK